MQEEDDNKKIKANRRRVRFIGVGGMAIGIIVIYANPNYFSDKVIVDCAYWLFWSVAMLCVFLLYIMFLINLRANIIHARHTIHQGWPEVSQKVNIYGMYFEGLITGSILLISFGVLFVFGTSCYFQEYTGKEVTEVLGYWFYR